MFVPIIINRLKGSADQIATRANLEFASQQLPGKRVTDGIGVSLLVIQYMIMLSRNTGGGQWWLSLKSGLALASSFLFGYIAASPQNRR